MTNLFVCIRVVAILSLLPFTHVVRQTDQGHIISGRVLDPLGLRPAPVVLQLGRLDGSGSISTEVFAIGAGGSSLMPPKTLIGADGSFVASRLKPGKYVLKLVKDSTVIGLTVVTMEDRDVTQVTVAIRRETAVHGRFRMESDNPAAVWPPSIVVNSFLALDGEPLLDGVTAEGAMGGRFILRNALGPRVIRCGYRVSPGSPWWPSRVLLNGSDIGNVPTDFSEHENGALEVVFTQHPARVRGIIKQDTGRASGAWAAVISPDPELQQQWSTTSSAVQADQHGEFRMALLPGRYLARAYPPSPFPTRRLILRQLLGESAVDLVPFRVGERQTTTIDLTMSQAPHH